MNRTSSVKGFPKFDEWRSAITHCSSWILALVFRAGAELLLPEFFRFMFGSCGLDTFWSLLDTKDGELFAVMPEARKLVT
jgi:hypothetical protein